MTRRILLIGMTGLFAAMLIPGQAPSAWAPVGPNDSPLAAVPAQSPVVVQLRGVERTKDRLHALAKNAMPDMATMAAAQVDQIMTGGIMGRKLQGLHKDGPVFAAFLEMPMPGSEVPAMAIIARVTKFSDFRDGLLKDDERKALKTDPAGFEESEIEGQPVFFVDLKEYAVVTPKKEVATVFTKKFDGLHTKVSKETAAKLLESDLSLYVNLTAVNKEFGEQIKEARSNLTMLFDAVPAGTDKASMDMVKGMIGGAFQLVEDGRVFIAAAEFQPNGLGLHFQTQIGTDTASNKHLKDQKPNDLPGLGKLTRGAMIYTGSQFAGDIMKAMSSWTLGAVAEGPAEEQLKQAIELMGAAGNSSNYSAAGFPAHGVSVASYADCAKAVEAHLKLFGALSEGGQFQKASIKGKPEIKKDAESHRGFKLTSVHLQWDLDKMLEQLPAGGEAVKAATAKLMGEDLRSWFGTDGKVVLTATAKDWPSAKKMIDDYLDAKSPLSGDAAYEATRKHLPTKSNMITLVDLAPFAQIMGDYMLAMFKAIPGFPFPLPDGIKPVKTSPSYLGMSVTLQSGSGSVDVFLPAAAVKEVRKIVDQVLQGGAN